MGGLDDGKAGSKQLYFSLLWNRHDMAADIMTKNNVGNEDIEKFLTIALIENKQEFVKMFTEITDLRDFLTKKKLEELYSDTLKTQKENSIEKFLQKFLKPKEGGKIGLESLTKKLSDISNIYYNPVHFDDSKNVQATEKSIEKSSAIKKSPIGLAEKVTECAEPAKSDSQFFLRPERELFVYSLLFVRPEASEYFWEDMTCKTSAAIFAVLISKTILKSREIRDDSNLQSRVVKLLENYKFKATGILNTCYGESAELSQQILQLKHEPWGSKSCLELATQADYKDFIAQSSCQTLIQEVWLGKLRDCNPLWKIIGASLVPFFVPFLSFKGTVSDEAEKKQVANQEEKSISVAKKLKFFYTAPVITFTLNVIATLLFLILFSIVTLEGNHYHFFIVLNFFELFGLLQPTEFFYHRFEDLHSIKLTCLLRRQSKF